MTELFTERPEAYMAGDRRRAVIEGRDLPDRVLGSALFADISGFTPLTEALADELGPKRGAEELTANLNRVFHAVIDEVDRFGGEVIYFGGDAITCWLDGDDGSRGAACGLAIQSVMGQVGRVRTPAGTEVELAIKVAVAVGPARRFAVGDPSIQRVDVLAGRIVDELADAEHLAARGEVVLATSALRSLGDRVAAEERLDAEDGVLVGVVDRLRIDVPAVAVPAANTDLTEDMVRPWLLPAVHERLVSGRGEFLSELRSAYPLFMRFGGIEYDDDPEAMAKLDGFVSGAQVILSTYGGNLLQLILGDKGAYLYAVFGTPHAHEDDAVRASAAALELLALEHRSAARDLQIGIAHGRLRSGTYGHPKRRTFTCLGDAVNLSARLMSRAPAGQVYLSDDVFQAAGDRVVGELVGDLTVKGKTRPVRVHSLIGLRRGPAKREVRYPLPLVGRERELAILDRARTRMLAGQGQTVALAAEAGRGKSRLIAEVVRDFRRTGLTVAFGEAQSFGRTTSYLVWREVWRTLFGLDDDEEPGRQRRALERQLEALGPSYALRAPLLADIVGLDIDDNDLTGAFDAKLRKTSLESLLTDVLSHRAAGAPIVIVLEDCHWLDALSRDLLEALVRATAALPVLFLLAYRPADSPGGGLGLELLPQFTELVLDRLEPAEATLVAEGKLQQLYGAGALVAPELIDLVVTRAEGNPFYLEELISFVHGLGIDPSDAAAVRHVEVPDSLQRLVLGRIDLLAEAPRSAIKVASVVGRTFETPLVHGVYPELGTEDDIDERFDVARRADLIAADRIEDRSWIFLHVVTREVAYDSLPFAMREDLHERVGSYLEERGPDAIERDLDLLAHHYWHTARVDKKREYLTRAGVAAQARYANEAAADYYERALPLVDDQARAPLLRRLGKVLELRGGWADAGTTYERAIDLAHNLHDAAEEARARADLAEALRKQGRFDDARQQLARAEDLFADVADDAGLGLVRHLSGTLASQQGRYDEARSSYEASLAIRERLGDRLGVGSLFSNLAVVAEVQGDLERAREMNERALAVRQETGDRWAISVSLNNLGMVAQLQQDFLTAQQRFEESMRLAVEVGDRWVVAVGHHNLGNAWLGLGDLGLSGAEFVQALRAYETYEDRWSLALLVEDVVHLALARDRIEDAFELMGATDAFRVALDAPRPPSVAATLDAALAAGVSAHTGTSASGDPTAYQTAIDTARRRGQELDQAAVSELMLRICEVPVRTGRVLA